jgi:hypothetical protein
MLPVVRAHLHKRLREESHDPEAGICTVTSAELREAWKRHLVTGEVEACDGTRVTHDSVPLTVHQIGVCLTTYTVRGQSFGYRLFRHDITQREDNPIDALEHFMRRRATTDDAEALGVDQSDEAPSMSSLKARAVMTYAERAMLLKRSKAPWRLGHGSALPYEILVGAGDRSLIERSITLLHELLAGHTRWIFVPSRVADRGLKTVATALSPLEYAVIGDSRHVINGYFREGYQRPNHYELRTQLHQLRDEVARDVMQCVCRASAFAPGQMFYAHRDHVHEAARIVMADSVLAEHRGFPNLIGLADALCKQLFDARGLADTVEATYARMHQPYVYLPERATRRR